MVVLLSSTADQYNHNTNYTKCTAMIIIACLYMTQPTMRINITTIATPTTPPATAPTGTLPPLLLPVAATATVNISNATNTATLVYSYVHLSYKVIAEVLTVILIW